MDDILPPDPYIALGIQRDANENDVKSAYRKLALKCHPDKFPDAAVKKVKEAEFHKILQAYELLTDPERKTQWEMDCTLAELKSKVRDNARGSGHSTRHTDPVGAYKTRECAPNFATAPSHTQDRFAKYDEDDIYKPRKSSTKQQERPSARTEKVSTRAATEKKRAEQKKYHDKVKKSDRSDAYERTKLDSSDSDGYIRAKRSYREDDSGIKTWEDKLRDAENQLKRDNASSDRRKSEKSRDVRDREYSRDRDQHKVYATRDHNPRSENERPSPQRTSSSRHDIRTERSSTARRSHAAPKDRSYDSYRPTIVEDPDEIDYHARRPERRAPSMQTATSSPAALHAHLQDPPIRSRTFHHYPSTKEASPRIGLNRSETLPVHSNSSRPRETPQSSKLHQDDSGYSSPGTPETQYPQASYARAPQSSGNTHNSGVRYVSVSKDDYGRSSQNPNVITREPVTATNPRYATVSPKRRSSERERSPMTSGRPSYADSPFAPPPLARGATFTHDKPIPRPSMSSHAASSQAIPRIVEEIPSRQRERGRDRDRDRKMAYGEIDSEYHHSPKTVRPSNERKTSYRPDEISYSRRYSPADVQYQNKEPADEESYRRGFEDAKRLLAEERAGGHMPNLARRGTVY